MIAEIISWSVLGLVVVLCVWRKGRALDKVLSLVIISMPILAPSVADQIFLRGNIYRSIGILVVITILFRYGFNRSEPKVFDLKFTKYYLIFIGACILSALFSPQPVESTFRSLTFLEPLFFFILAMIVAYHYPMGFEKGNKALFLSLMIAIAYGIFQVLTQEDPLLDIGFRKHLSVFDYDINYLHDKRTFSGRITSVLGQPVYTAFLFIALSHILFYRFIISRKNQLIYFGLISLLLLLVFATGTRAAYPVVAFIVLSIMLKYGMRSLKIVLLVAFVVFIFGTFALQEETIEYLARSFDLSEANEANANAFQRLQLTFGLLRLALDHLWFGLGPGMIQKASVGALVSYDVKFEGLAGMENHFLGIFADTGIVGLSVYLLFMIQWFLSLRRGSASLPNEIDTYRSLLFIVLLFFFLGSFTVSNVVSVPMIFLFISYGLYVGKVKRLSTLHDMKLRENHTEGSPRLA